MSKQALCIQRSQLSIDFSSAKIQPIPDELFDLEAGLVDREICETGEEFIQLIPYIVLNDRAGRVFCYERGASGGEDRLHAKLSIGIGGHVECASIDTPSGLNSYLMDVLRSEGERELLEEAGIAATLGPFDGLIYTGASGQAVDKVHLGLLSVVHLSEVGEAVLKAEAGHIENGRWLTLAELLVPQTFDRLEAWSQAVVADEMEEVSRDIGSLVGALGGVVHQLSISSATGITATTAQELASVAFAVGDNLENGHAIARVYDDDSARDELAYLAQMIEDVRRGLGIAKADGS